jgi:hypothetical protein
MGSSTDDWGIKIRTSSQRDGTLVKGRDMLGWLNGAIEVGFGNNQRPE